MKALASQTARATEQIGAQIVAIRSATGEAVLAVRDVGVAIGQVETVAAAIAAAVEAQASAMREITGSVQLVTATATSAGEAMHDVLSIAGSTDASSVVALQAADAVGQTSQTLRSEVTEFLAAMSQGDDANRRLYERIPGNGCHVTVQFSGASVAQAVLVDISRGGMAVELEGDHPSGTDAELRLPGGGVVKGRVTRCAVSGVSFAFRQDSASLIIIDRALEIVRTRTDSKAA